ncbi:MULTISPECIES: hypothetical protein [Paraburkholderia]|jgi:hypothetical protein|uniref:Arginine/ornithine antiporter ArcD n=2 Tax=Paraburkholderia caribensis TaxID=75105 RepID=A0A9Q6S5Y0_9BURK|nr:MULTISPECIES: hypothetical protein [Paraburkholderia]MCO4877506.1 hypothetical protein [Paraburkholderia caribensis]PTB26863.1 hypothetical protein C9I56_21245 [Paraburkholderia caribensis]QLB65195.1 hypothetical protein A9O66_22650 [Paraburkholderia caribensis]
MNGVWATVIGSGIFHGVNPAMGWLFAAALGLQHGSRKALLMALPPLALGHAVSVMLVTTSAVALGLFTHTVHLRIVMGILLIAWAAYHHFYGHKQRVRVGMTAGFVGLALWSAAMATMHGAGLMLLPALLPLCGAGMPVGSSLESVGQVTAVHTVVTLVTASAIALAAYQYLGLGMLRRGWINFDWLWCGALSVTGVLLIVTG